MPRRERFGLREHLGTAGADWRGCMWRSRRSISFFLNHLVIPAKTVKEKFSKGNKSEGE